MAKSGIRKDGQELLEEEFNRLSPIQKTEAILETTVPQDQEERLQAILKTSQRASETLDHLAVFTR